MGSSYQMCPRGFESVVYDGVGRDLHEHRNFSFLPLGGDSSRPIGFSRPDRLSVKEACRGTPPNPSREGESRG